MRTATAMTADRVVDERNIVTVISRVEFTVCGLGVLILVPVLILILILILIGFDRTSITIKIRIRIRNGDGIGKRADVLRIFLLEAQLLEDLLDGVDDDGMGEGARLG